MTFVCATILLGSYCTAQLASIPREGAAPSPAPTYPVNGVVENSITHQPIARVLVDGFFDKVLTDDEGRFELHLPRETASIRLQRPGYGGSGPYNTQSASRVVNVLPGMPPVVFYLTPSASITARVELSSGDNPDGMRFSLFRKSVNMGRAQWEIAASAVSDGRGRVRFYSLAAPGSYVVCSDPAPDSAGISAAGAVTYGYPGRCFPGGADFKSAMASPLNLRPGQQAELDAELTRQPFYPVSIFAAASGRSRIPLIQVHTQSGQSVNVGMSSNSQTGIYRLKLPDGSYYAEADFNNGNGPNPSQFYGRVDFTVAGGPVTGLRLMALPVRPLSVEIHRDFTATNQQTGPAVVDGIISGRLISDSGPGLNMILVPVDPGEGDLGGGLRHDPNDPYGDLFQLQVATPGRYWVHVDASNDAYVSSITSGGVNLASQPLQVGAGGTSYPIEVTLRNDKGRLNCRLMLPPSAVPPDNPDAGEAAQVFVYAIPLFPTVEQVAGLTVQNDGENSQTDLPPGEYLLVASYQQQEFALGDAKEIARLADQGQKVNIQPGQTTTVVLSKIISGAVEAEP